MGFIHLPLFLLGGMLVDWTMFCRLEENWGVPTLDTDENGYRQLLFPRLIVTFASLMLVFFGTRGSTTNPTMIVVGGTAFFSSTVYGVYRLLSGNGR